MALVDIEAAPFLNDVLDTATRRYIATVLGELEEYTERKDKAISDLVKDDVNRCRRIIFRKLTGIEVEPRRGE